MRRKIVAVSSIIALALCFGRVGAWASADDAHACCRASAPSTPGPAFTECCAPAAVGAATRLSSDAAVITVVSPALSSALTFFGAAAQDQAPPGLVAFRADAPTRAPPLA